jgi:hypothetical protein
VVVISMVKIDEKPVLILDCSHFFSLELFVELFVLHLPLMANKHSFVVAVVVVVVVVAFLVAFDTVDHTLKFLHSYLMVDNVSM